MSIIIKGAFLVFVFLDLIILVPIVVIVVFVVVFVIAAIVVHRQFGWYKDKGCTYTTW